jgi:peptidoglycan hydrolase-like protein with peptidoglycan-binding domain
MRPTAYAAAPPAEPSPPPAAGSAPQPPEPTYAADDVRVVQETLQSEGLYLGELDGALNDETRAALRRYQRREGLPETARLDGETMRRLDADQSSSGASGIDDDGHPRGRGGPPR